MNDRRSFPHRVVYPGIRVLLSLGAPGGLLIVRSALAKSWPSVRWTWTEVSARPEIYTYVGLSTLVIFLLLGFLLGRKEDLLEAASTTDALTGLSNRRLFDTCLHQEVLRAERYGTPLALLLPDIDKLKDINDHGGHVAGDAAICAVARCLRENCRTTDLAARYGGDEFVVLAPETDTARALELASRLQSSLDDVRRNPEGASSIAPTISIGLSEFHRGDRCSPESLCQTADRALYEAKARGRNCAVSIPPTGHAGLPHAREARGQ